VNGSNEELTMPRYAFECSPCVLRFERNLRVDEHASYPCPSCRQPAPLVPSEFAFAFAPGSGAPANSGVHDLDYPSADKAVGRNAGDRWAHINAREAVKKQAREQGNTHALIRHTGKDYIDYEPMSDQGRDARKALARETFKRIRGERGQ
jgi:putative FmdB family regulatory protein